MNIYFITVTVIITFKFDLIYSYNRLPYFVPISGDLSNFSLSENTPIGSIVYQLKGLDPENTHVYYSISGPDFVVDSITGNVQLQKPLDREKNSEIEVIVTIRDQEVFGFEANIVSLRRIVTVLDENDNPPILQNIPYIGEIFENSQKNTTVKFNIMPLIVDMDTGINADLIISCYFNKTLNHFNSCDMFQISGEQISNGRYAINVMLKGILDFETQSFYKIDVKISDKSAKPYVIFGEVTVQVLDIQDEPPVFINVPYSVSIFENLPPNTPILKISAKDGDATNQRPVYLEIENDVLDYFYLITSNKSDEEILLMTTNKVIDREDSLNVQNDGVYNFKVKATEIINDELSDDYSYTDVVIVIKDEDDQKPIFNQNLFELNVPEDIRENTFLTGLKMIVDDKDLGINSQYNLSLVDVKNSNNVFQIVNMYCEGKTFVIIKIINNTNLDYDMTNKPMIIFDVIASKKNKTLSSSRVIVRSYDVNDNSPKFEQDNYKFQISENSEIGYEIGILKAIDFDSGINKDLKYQINSQESINFEIDPLYGILKLKKKLDYESRKFYTIIAEVIDGGNRTTSAAIFINVTDENDNAPFFEKNDYYRLLPEKVTNFEPQFFIQAYDIDSLIHGGNQITYFISSVNSINNDTFIINNITGELLINRPPLLASDTPNGQYEIIVNATDHGKPQLSNSTLVIIRIGIAGNQRPVFKGNYITSNGQNEYKITIPEDIKPNSDVIKIFAFDPDGLDSQLTYEIIEGNRDVFTIDKKNGLIYTTENANLDLERIQNIQKIIVKVTDSGKPIPESSIIPVYVTIRDINNKSPKFLNSMDFLKVTEDISINSTITVVKAIDPDSNSIVNYEIVKPIHLLNKKSLLSETNETIFQIDHLTGQIKLSKQLNYDKTFMILLKIRAFDTNATYVQEDFKNISILVQKSQKNYPIFLNNGWTPDSPIISMKIDEEIPIENFLSTDSDNDLLSVLSNGEILLTKRLDYENLTKDSFHLKVKAISINGNETFATIAKLIFLVNNINDNKPVFKQKKYYTKIFENIKYPKSIIQIQATDADYSKFPSSHNNYSINNGIVTYSLLVNYKDMFQINSTSGLIEVKKNINIDREQDKFIELIVVASDSGSMQQRNEVLVLIEILDVNDNEPKFLKMDYNAVILENVKINTSVINITAYDLDEGLNASIFYSIIEENNANNYFTIDNRSGEVRTKKSLNGKGRINPYKLRIKAEDGYGLYSDVYLNAYISDIKINDGVPVIIKPEENEIIEILENTEKGSTIYQIVATDPDDSQSSNGQLTFEILQTGRDFKCFDLDKTLGILRIKCVLNQELKSDYVIGVVVSDRGIQPQMNTRIIRINVIDIDDNDPIFLRKEESPLVFTIKEEIEIDSFVGLVEAEDKDTYVNGKIDYRIKNGNEKNLFKIEISNNTNAIIRTANRIDYEEISEVILTLKCFKFNSDANLLRSTGNYDPKDRSEIQIQIIIQDIDDNYPKFKNKDNMIIGINSKIPTLSRISIFEASDIDSSSVMYPIEYHIFDCIFYSTEINSTNTQLINENKTNNCKQNFEINNKSGHLYTASTLKIFNNGYFNITIEAYNGKSSYTSLLVLILDEKQLLKFVYQSTEEGNIKKFSQIRNVIQTKFKKGIDVIKLEMIRPIKKQKTVENCLESLDTSCCFQIIDNMKMLTTDEAINLLMATNEFKKISDQYNIMYLEKCNRINSVIQQKMMLSQYAILSIACLIGIISIITFHMIALMSEKKINK